MNKQIVTDEEFSPKLILFGGYVLTAVVGIPLWFIGVLLHQPGLTNAWTSFANSFAGMCLEKSLKVPGKTKHRGSSEVIEFLQASLDSNHLLSINSVGCRFTRVVMHTTEAGVRRRIDLTDIFEGELELFGIEHTLTSAMDYTIQQIENGVHAEKLSHIGRIQRVKPASAGQNKPQAHESASAPVSSPVVNPVPDAKHEAASATKELRPSRVQRQKKAKGKVVFAGQRVVDVSGQRPYETFAVVLMDQGREFTFSGIDLAEQFYEGVFGNGDLIEITPLGKVSFTVQQGGKTESRTKNKFQILKFS